MMVKRTVTDTRLSVKGESEDDDVERVAQRTKLVERRCSDKLEETNTPPTPSFICSHTDLTALLSPPTAPLPLEKVTKGRSEHEIKDV